MLNLTCVKFQGKWCSVTKVEDVPERTILTPVDIIEAMLLEFNSTNKTVHFTYKGNKYCVCSLELNISSGSYPPNKLTNVYYSVVNTQIKTEMRKPFRVFENAEEELVSFDVHCLAIPMYKNLHDLEGGIRLNFTDLQDIKCSIF